jgi:hypothetical protein
MAIGVAWATNPLHELIFAASVTNLGIMDKPQLGGIL